VILGENSKRLGIFFFYDEDGIVDDYLPYYLKDLNENLDELLVVVNGCLNEVSAASIKTITNNILIRENIGFDVWAYKDGLSHYGWGALNSYDEIVFANFTNFGPIYPFQEAFGEMRSRDVDFWGLTKHYGHPFDPYNKCKYGYIPAHIQSSFIVVRKSMFSSEQYQTFWDTMPMIKGYEDSICSYEAIFTKDFESYGFRSDVYVDTDDLQYCHNYPLMLYPLELIKDRHCPIFKRKTFFNQYEEFIDVSCGQSALELYNYLIEHTDYDVGMIWRNLLRTANMYDLKSRMQLNYVLPTKLAAVADNPQKIALFMHIYHLDMMDTCKHYADSMPPYADIYITTSVEKLAEVEAYFSDFGGRSVTVVQVENRGRDVSSLLIGLKPCAEQYDVVCFIHDKKSAYDKPYIIGESFAYKCYENVLANSVFVQNVLQTFEENPYLGLLVPPTPNHGSYFYLVGLEWQNDYLATEKLAKKMKLNVPISDDKPPIAPFGTCFWFRPKAMIKLFEYGFTYDDFPPEPYQGQDGDLMHAIERIYPFAVQSAGYYTGWLLSDKFARMEITNLHKQLRDSNQTLFWNFGVQERHALLHCVSASKNMLEILSAKHSFADKCKMLARKLLGTKGYEWLRIRKNEFIRWKGKRYE